MKQFKRIADKEGNVILLDKNQQVCGGTFFSTHKGRPCIVEGRSVMSPVTAPFEVVDRYGNKKTVWLFDHYEVLIENYSTAE